MRQESPCPFCVLPGTQGTAGLQPIVSGRLRTCIVAAFAQQRMVRAIAQAWRSDPPATLWRPRLTSRYHFGSAWQGAAEERP